MRFRQRLVKGRHNYDAWISIAVDLLDTVLEIRSTKRVRIQTGFELIWPSGSAMRTIGWLCPIIT